MRNGVLGLAALLMLVACTAQGPLVSRSSPTPTASRSATPTPSTRASLSPSPSPASPSPSPSPISVSPGSWQAGHPMYVPRADFAAVLLSDFKVLLVGGQTSPSTALATAELFDPSTGLFQPAASMHAARAGHTATLLPGGKVLVTGGFELPSGGALASAELYDPVTNTWSAAASMAKPRAHHVALLMASGRVFVTGGDGGTNSSDPIGSEVYDPATNTWTGTPTTWGDRPFGPAVAQLASGLVMIYGGVRNAGPGAQIEFYDPALGRAFYGPIAAVTDHSTAAVLDDGTVLIAGGQENYQPSGALSSTTLYDGRSASCIQGSCGGSFTAGPQMNVGHDHHTMTLLRNGRVLVVGGRYGTSDPNGVAEVYEPVAGKWWPAGTLQTARAYHVAVAFPDGRVLVAGGFVAGGAATPTIEIYTPAN